MQEEIFIFVCFFSLHFLLDFYKKKKISRIFAISLIFSSIRLNNWLLSLAAVTKKTI